MADEFIHMRGVKLSEEQAATACEVHGWSPEDWVTKFVPLLRERHGKGGLNVCKECLLAASRRLREQSRATGGDNGTD